MNAYKLADEYGTYAESHDWGKQAQDMLRQQTDRIAELEKVLQDGIQAFGAMQEQMLKEKLFGAEPVAWAYYDDWHKLKLSQTMPHEDGSFPLYTTPQDQADRIAELEKQLNTPKTYVFDGKQVFDTTPQTKLSDEEIWEMSHPYGDLAWQEDTLLFARAIEERHGIK